MKRERLGSRLGFILLSAGCAIGVGNVWKFPYMVGQYGGGMFVLIYLFFLLIMGVPIMAMEFSIGRASRKSPALMYQQLEPAGSKWHYHGYVAVVGNYILMMFYTTVTGWMLKYFVSTAKGEFIGLDKAGIEGKFTEMLSEPTSMLLFMAFVVIIGFAICSFGVQKGLERITKYMMTALLVIMLVLAINSMFMPGGKEGLEFYLLPNIERMKSIGIGNVIVGAMNQAFFTLSLGMGAMAIFGSYLNKERRLLGESVNIALLDIFVAFVAGLIIFPACFAYDVQPDSGPNLIFVTLPNIFKDIPLGRLWGSLFFIFLSFAALSTVLAVFEGILACTCDLFGWSRKKSCLINCIIVLVLSVPCVLGFNVLSGFTPFGEGSTVMDLEDFIISNIILPLGSLVFLLFCTNKRGWGWKKFQKEANTGKKGLKIQNWMRIYLSYILPIFIIALFVMGLYNFFK